MGTCFSSTDRLVKDGMQDEFKARWTSFLTWTRETHDGVSGAIPRTAKPGKTTPGSWSSSSLALRSAMTCRAARSCTSCLSGAHPSGIRFIFRVRGE